MSAYTIDTVLYFLVGFFTGGLIIHCLWYFFFWLDIRKQDSRR